MEGKFGFDEVKQYAGDMVKYSDGRIVIFEGTHTFEDMQVQTEAYVVVLCTKGSAQLKKEDGADVEVQPNDVILCHPDQFFERVRTSLDFWCEGVLIAPEYFDQLLMVCAANVCARHVIGVNPVLHLTAGEAEEMRRDFDYLNFKMNSSRSGSHRAEMMDCLLQSLIFNSADMLLDRIVPADAAVRYTSGQAIVNNFLALVEKETPQLREIKAYANLLCVTPKYLSAVCRRETGRTAHEIVNTKASKKIRRLLADPTLSVKQVARMCGFDNLSFFGKFVKRELGLSPRCLRSE